MNVHLAQELLNELGSCLETLETQQSALLQCLREKGIITDDQLAPYLSQASNASSVRWRAARVRLEHIFAAAEKEQQIAKPQENQPARVQTSPQKEAERGKEESTGEGAKKQEPKAEGSPDEQEKRDNEKKKVGNEVKSSPEKPKDEAA